MPFRPLSPSVSSAPCSSASVRRKHYSLRFASAGLPMKPAAGASRDVFCMIATRPVSRLVSSPVFVLSFVVGHILLQRSTLLMCFADQLADHLLIRINSSKLSLRYCKCVYFLTSLSLGNVLLFCRLWCCTLGTSQRHNNDPNCFTGLSSLLFRGLSHPECKEANSFIVSLQEKKQDDLLLPGSAASQPNGFHPERHYWPSGPYIPRFQEFCNKRNWPMDLRWSLAWSWFHPATLSGHLHILNLFSVCLCCLFQNSNTPGCSTIFPLVPFIPQQEYRLRSVYHNRETYLFPLINSW